MSSATFRAVLQVLAFDKSAYAYLHTTRIAEQQKVDILSLIGGPTTLITAPATSVKRQKKTSGGGTKKWREREREEVAKGYLIKARILYYT